MIYLEALELKSMLETEKGMTIVDIREPYEVEVCSIGGLHIPMGEVCNRINELKAYDRVVIMCKSGKRAEALANLLIEDYGLQNVSVLRGGIQAWIDDVDNSIEIY